MGLEIALHSRLTSKSPSDSETQNKRVYAGDDKCGRDGIRNCKYDIGLA